nr:hypothetical protein [Tanacetum cinerariifolium]
MDLGDICFIKDEEGRTITDEEEIKKIWGEYFTSLFNAREREGHKEGLGPSRQPHPECYYSRISQAEVSAKMPKEWRLTEDIPIFKTKAMRKSAATIEGIDHNEEVDVCIGDRILQPKESFRYLGSMLHKSGRIDEDVSNRIKAAWMKWRAATRVLCDRNVPLKLKGKLYRVVIRPAMLYGSECWPIMKALANRVEVAELRMLRWTCGKTSFDMIPNGVYRARRPQSSPVRRVDALVVDGLRRRGRSKLRWEDKVKHDMKELLLSEDMTSDRNEWRARIRLGGYGVDFGSALLVFLLPCCVVGLVLVSFFGCFALRACPFPALPAPCPYACFRPFVLCVVALLLVFLASLVFFLCRCLLGCSALVIILLYAIWDFFSIALCMASRLCIMVAFRVCLLVLALPAPVFVCLLCAFVLCVVVFA